MNISIVIHLEGITLKRTHPREPDNWDTSSYKANFLLQIWAGFRHRTKRTCTFVSTGRGYSVKVPVTASGVWLSWTPRLNFNIFSTQRKYIQYIGIVKNTKISNQ